MEQQLISDDGIVPDISQQKIIFRSFKENEPHYQEFLNSLPAGVYTCNKEGSITFFNEVAVQLWGYRPTLNDPALKFCACYKVWLANGEFVPPEQTPMAVALRTGESFRNVEVIVERPDGSKFYANLNINPLLDENNGIAGAINIFQDISNFKKTELALRESEVRYRKLASSLERKIEEKASDLEKKNEELRKSEERYHKMVEEVEDYAIMLMDRNGIIQNWNKGAEKIKGYKEQEIIGRSFGLFYPPEDRERRLPEQLIGEATRKGKAIAEGWRIRKDGSKFWGSTVITALHDADNNVIGFTKVTRDLTERKIAEDKLNEYRNELEFQNSELEQFVYVASHDMKEPLRKIHLYNSFIADNPDNLLDSKSREYLTRSINAVRRMDKLIEDLLAYSRATSSMESFREVNLNIIAEEIIAEHKEELEQRGMQTDIGELPVIWAIPFQCKQLMDNLISNSIKYKHPQRAGIIKINSQCVSGTAIKEQQLSPNELYYRISVADNGIGFEPEYAAKIFEVFQRLNNLPDTKGSGIGLAICKKIAQNHKGFIVAEGRPNEGARFDIYFPQHRDSIQPAEC